MINKTIYHYIIEQSRTENDSLKPSGHFRDDCIKNLLSQYFGTSLRKYNFNMTCNHPVNFIGLENRS